VLFGSFIDHCTRDSIVLGFGITVRKTAPLSLSVLVRKICTFDAFNHVVSFCHRASQILMQKLSAP